MNNKRGWFFSIDALIALSLIVLVLAVFYPFVDVQQKQSEVHYDLIKVLSALDPENDGSSVLEETARLYWEDTSNLQPARDYIDVVIGELDFGNENVGIWINNQLVWPSDAEISDYGEASRVESARQMVFGLREGENAVGYSAFASLGSLLRQDYHYFGGYVGDGDITLRVEYNGVIEPTAELEAAVSSETGDFDVWVNNNFADTYEIIGDDFTPGIYSIPTTGATWGFQSGTNTVELRGENLHAAGGFLKITYDTNVQYEQPEKYYFPGIDGAVNIYDGFYVPGELTSLNVLLHMNSNADVFLNLGDVNIYEGNTGGVDQMISIDGGSIFTDLQEEGLTFADLSEETVPLRLGLVGVDYELDVAVDLISVYESTSTMASSLSNLKEAHLSVIDKIRDVATARMGLVGYRVSLPTPLSDALTNDFNYLTDRVNNWPANQFISQNRDLCKAIDDANQGAVFYFTDPNNQNPAGTTLIRVAIIMAAGDLTHCEGSDPLAAEHAADRACAAAAVHDITFYTIGFGNIGDQTRGALERIADCSDGKYVYESDLNLLVDIYDDVIDAIIARYQLQTVYTSENIETKLYSDSYIEFVYDPAEPESGVVFTVEKPFDTGSFDITDVFKVLEARVTSYSGPRWTDSVTVNNNLIYDLSSYGTTSYIELGDPFNVQLPVSSLQTGPNTVSLTTGLSPGETNGGSASNKIIYKVKGGAFAYSDIRINADGCVWHIEFEGNPVPQDFEIPSGATGDCYFDSTLGHEDGSIANLDDAYQEAVLDLLNLLDLNNDGRVDTMFSEQDLQISLDQVTGIPMPLSLEVEARTWYA